MSARDPRKYTWMPPDPPRIPRRTPLTPVQAALCVIGLLLILGALYVAGLEYVALGRFVGWMLSQPVVEAGR